MSNPKSGRANLARSTARRSAAALNALEAAVMLTEEIRDKHARPLAAFIELAAGDTIEELLEVRAEETAVAAAGMKAIVGGMLEAIAAQFREWAGEDETAAR